MDFEDQVLVRLADPATRNGVFSQDALAAMAAAGYDHPELAGPYQAVFDELQLAVDLRAQVRADGCWQRPGDQWATELRLSVTGLGDAPSPGLTALWSGSVVAQAAVATAPVTAVEVTPSDGEHLGLQIGFAPAPATTVARSLPVTVAILARDVGAPLTALLAQSVLVRQALQDAGREPALDPDLRRRVSIVVAWVLPAAVFDDTGWPGGDTGTPPERNQARRQAAAAWLAGQGIALAVLDPT
jgi:hypothetical protein